MHNSYSGCFIEACVDACQHDQPVLKLLASIAKLLLLLLLGEVTAVYAAAKGEQHCCRIAVVGGGGGLKNKGLHLHCIQTG